MKKYRVGISSFEIKLESNAKAWEAWDAVNIDTTAALRQDWAGAWKHFDGIDAARRYAWDKAVWGGVRRLVDGWYATGVGAIIDDYNDDTGDYEGYEAVMPDRPRMTAEDAINRWGIEGKKIYQHENGPAQSGELWEDDIRHFDADDSCFDPDSGCPLFELNEDYLRKNFTETYLSWSACASAPAPHALRFSVWADDPDGDGFDQTKHAELFWADTTAETTAEEAYNKVCKRLKRDFPWAALPEKERFVLEYNKAYQR